MKPMAYFPILSAAVLGGATSSAHDYDLVINNGRVIDPETKFDAVANVGIKDGKIVAVITKDAITGKRQSTPPVTSYRQASSTCMLTDRTLVTTGCKPCRA